MADTKDQILATAFRLFFEKGYKEVTMNQLVKETGLSKGAFYHYFPSKEALYRVTLERYFDLYMENFSLNFNEKKSLKKNLEDLFSRFAYLSAELKESLQTRKFGMANYLVFLQEAMKKDRFRKRIAEYNSRFYEELSRWIDRARENKEVDPGIDSMVLAKHLTSMMKGMTVLYSFGQGMEPLDKTFRDVINQLFNYIEPRDENH